MVWRTTIITLTTCFLLGTTFTHWIADHNVLWRSPLTPEALASSIEYYALLGNGPPKLGYVYIAVGIAAVLAAGGKLMTGWRGKGGEVLWDGASVLLVASVTYNQVTEVYPTLISFPNPLPSPLTDHEMFPILAGAVRDLANDNIITSVMLTGVMLLQAGRYYSSKGTGEGYPRSAPPSTVSSPGSEVPPKLSERHATPFRELTEEEALELRSSSANASETESKASSLGPNSAKRSHRKPSSRKH